MEPQEQKYEENQEIRQAPIQDNEPQIDFLEVSVISEIIQIVEQIDSKCKGQIGEDIVNERIKQLAYSKILCNVYGKDITYLIKAYTNLGIAYLDIEYYEQAQEHLLNAFKLNENLSSDDNMSMKEYQIKILINLSKCYLEDSKGRLDIAQQISEKSLSMNKKFFGEDHVSNADIYYILSKINTKAKNFDEALKNLQSMFKIYEKIYGYDLEKSAKISMEMGQIYELAGEIKDAIEFYENSYNIWKKIIDDGNYDVLFHISMKLSELYAQIKDFKNSYEKLKYTEKEFGDKIKRSLKDRAIYQKCVIKACSYNNDIDLLLEENLKLVEILKESDENKKTLAKTLVQIGSIYLENNEKEKGLDYLYQAKRIFNENGDKKCENEINIRIENELNKLNGEQEESKEVKENKNE
jgi:tetratricopeptide (TPR) repeat protein